MFQLLSNSGDPDQTLHSLASDLGLQCLPNTLLGVSRLQRVKTTSPMRKNASKAEMSLVCRMTLDGEET